MSKNKNRGKNQTEKMRWSPVIIGIITIFIWVMYLVYIEHNDHQYRILQDSKQLVFIVAGISISFTWKSAIDEIAKQFTSLSWINYCTAIFAPFAVLLLWLAAAFAWTLIPTN